MMQYDRNGLPKIITMQKEQVRYSIYFWKALAFVLVLFWFLY